MNPNEHRQIVLIIVYMGPLPFWMPAFLLSCRFNPGVQWLIYTDREFPADCPGNVTFVHMDIGALNQRASDVLGVHIHIEAERAYKICDLRPAFGEIFKEDILAYDFWGHCDIDLLWGSISAYITNNILNNYDVITSRIDRLSGHFCLYRNIPELNSFFHCIPRVKEKMSDNSKHYALDENEMTSSLSLHARPSKVIGIKRMLKLCPNIRPRLYWRDVLTTSGEYQRRILKNMNLFLTWSQGRTYGVDGEEFMYLHFHELRKYMHTFEMQDISAAKRIKIGINGIFQDNN